jgi:hypothetical protein
MSRLTKKENDIYTFTHTNENRQFVVYDLCNKLGKLEDLEDDFGCQIEVFVEAIKDGIIVEKYRFDVEPDYDWDDTYVHSNIIASKNLGLFIDYTKSWFLLLETEDDCYYYYLKDYKNTWWLPSDFKAKLIKGFWRW